MIVDGKKISQDIISSLLNERGALPPVLRLGVLMGAEDAASQSFVKIKERVADRLHVVVVREQLDAQTTTALALRAIERLAAACAGIIVQLPLPPQIDTQAVLEALPAGLDVDALKADAALAPPVAGAIAEVLARTGVPVAGKRAVVVGAGRLVGLPAAALLRTLGAQAEVVTKDDGALAVLADADIVVLGAGVPGLVKPGMLKQGVVLIDAGTSEQGGRVAGDADPACADVAAVFTPVPGGIGPIAVAMIFKNLFALARRAKIG